jgi:predicted PurR-regulated permease PerM
MPDLLVLVSSLGGIAMFGIAGFIIGPVLAGVFMTSLSVFFATCADEPDADSAVRLIGLEHDSPSSGSEIGRIP